MNLKVLCLSATLGLPLLGLAGTNSVNSFAGAYVGLGVEGAQVSNTTQTALDESDTPTSLASSSPEQNSFAMGANVLGGYNFTLSNHWILGLQADYSDNDKQNNLNASQDLNFGSGPVEIDSNSTVSGSFKLRRVYGVDADLGLLINSSNLLFAGIGFVQGNLSENGNCINTNTIYVFGVPEVYTGNTYFNINKTLSGVKGFMGAQQALTENLSLKEQISYTDFQSTATEVVVDVPDPLHTNGVQTNTINFKPKLMTASLDLVYGFTL